MPDADNGHAASGHWPLGTVRMEVLVVALRTRRHGLDLGRRYAFSQELAFIGSREAHRPGAGRIFGSLAGFDEPLPIGKTFLEGTYGTIIQVIAARAYGRAEHGVQLSRGDAKLLFDDAECSARNKVERSHTASMHDRNEWGMQSEKHDGEAVGDENAQGCIGQRCHQRVGLDTGEAVLQRRGINNAHPVSMDLTCRGERRPFQTQRLQQRLAMSAYNVARPPVVTEIEPTFRRVDLARGKGASQRGMALYGSRYQIRHFGRATPPQASFRNGPHVPLSVCC